MVLLFLININIMYALFKPSKILLVSFIFSSMNQFHCNKLTECQLTPWKKIGFCSPTGMLTGRAQTNLIMSQSNIKIIIVYTGKEKHSREVTQLCRLLHYLMCVLK